MTIVQNQPQKLLILGCGDIGQRLAQQLAPQGYTCIGVRRTPMDDLPYLQYQALDVTQPRQLEPLLADAQVVVVSTTPSERSDAGYAQAYGETCRQLLASIAHLAHPPRLLVFISSTSVYGQQDNSWVDEHSPCEPTGFSGQRLLEAEALIRHSGLRHCIVRPSGIYGPGRERLITQVRQGQASNSMHFTNRIHSDDLARALAHLITLSEQREIDELYLVSDSTPAPMAEVASWIGQQLAVAEVFAKNTAHTRGNKRINNQRLLNTGFKLRYADYREGYIHLLHSTNLHYKA